MKGDNFLWGENNLETVNTVVNDKKLSHLQKTILRSLDGSDEFWGVPVKKLSWRVARDTQEKRDENYIPKERRRQLIYQSVMSGEMDQVGGIMALNRIHGDLLTPKFRVSFSRALKRLYERGFIKRITEMKIEDGFWVSYSGGGYTRRVVLEDDGCKWIESNLHGLS